MTTSTKRIKMRLDELRKHLARANSEILIISPYLTPGTLSDVLSEIPEETEVTVICSWRDRDLHSGSSHLETYHLCQKRGWTLRVDHDGMPRTIHLKAYVVDGQDAMMGSANMTRRGMRSNIESMIPVTLSEHPSLSDAVQSSVEGSLEVDEAVCRRFKERVESFPPLETPKFPKFDPIHGETETQILELMPDMPTISQLIELQSIRDALDIRGIRFGRIRRLLREKPLLNRSRETINEKTANLMRKIIDADKRLDIQKRYGTDCLVWKVHKILNLEIRKHLLPYTGRPLRDIGLEEESWHRDTNGTTVRNFCLSKLPPEIRIAISNLSTSDKSIRLGANGKPLNPSQIGPRIVLTNENGEMLDRPVSQMLPEDSLRDSLWLPSFCIFEAPSGTKMGDAVILGFGLWESDVHFVADMDYDLNEDKIRLENLDSPFFDNPFRMESESRTLFTKIANAKGNAHLPLGHPDRKMSRYLTQKALASISDDILSHDH